jgi:hypothetical protein
MIRVSVNLLHLILMPKSCPHQMQPHPDTPHPLPVVNMVSPMSAHAPRPHTLSLLLPPPHPPPLKPLPPQLAPLHLLTPLTRPRSKKVPRSPCTWRTRSIVRTRRGAFLEVRVHGRGWTAAGPVVVDDVAHLWFVMYAGCYRGSAVAWGDAVVSLVRRCMYVW